MRNPLLNLGHSKESLESLYRFHDPTSGLTVDPQRLVLPPEIHPGHGDSGRYLASIGGYILDKHQDMAGHFNHLLYQDDDGGIRAHHDYFSLEPHVQEGGFSKRWYNDMFNRYTQAGIHRVDLLADIDVGSYAWHKHGFTPDREETGALRRTWQQDLANDTQAGNLTEDEYMRGMKLREPHEFADFDVGRKFPIETGEQFTGTKQGGGHYGKAFYMKRPGVHNNRDWHGTLELQPDNPHYQRGVAYRSQQQHRPGQVLKAFRTSSTAEQVHHIHCHRGHTHLPVGIHLGTGTDAHLFE